MLRVTVPYQAAKILRIVMLVIIRCTSGNKSMRLAATNSIHNLSRMFTPNQAERSLVNCRMDLAPLLWDNNKM
jgi:hypothetical protein